MPDTRRSCTPPVSKDSTSLRQTIEASLSLQLESGARFTEESANRCFSCHSQSLPAVAVRMAQERGLVFNHARAEEALRDTLRAAHRRAGERLETDFGTPLISAWFLLGVDAAGHKPDLFTDEYALAVARTQARDGQWRSGTPHPPSGFGDVTATALSIRALQRYAPPTKQREFKERIQRATKWLEQLTSHTTEERAMQLLGLYWGGSRKEQLASSAAALLKSQRADGGWAQLTTLESDSYATGQSLYALHATGALSANDARFQNGVRLLLETQHHDSSWFVPTRAFPLQRPIDAVFPHGEHQWSSMLGTTWATTTVILVALKPD